MHKHLNLIDVHGMVSSKEFPFNKQSQHDTLLWSIMKPFTWWLLHSCSCQCQRAILDILTLVVQVYYKNILSCYFSGITGSSQWRFRQPIYGSLKKLSQGAVPVYNMNIPIITILCLASASPLSIPSPILAVGEVFLKNKGFLSH